MWYRAESQDLGWLGRDQFFLVKVSRAFRRTLSTHTTKYNRLRRRLQELCLLPKYSRDDCWTEHHSGRPSPYHCSHRWRFRPFLCRRQVLMLGPKRDKCSYLTGEASFFLWISACHARPWTHSYHHLYANTCSTRAQSQPLSNLLRHCTQKFWSGFQQAVLQYSAQSWPSIWTHHAARGGPTSQDRLRAWPGIVQVVLDKTQLLGTP